MPPNAEVDAAEVERGESKEYKELDFAGTGSGTTEDPYVVDWLDNDPENPLRWVSVC